MEAYWLVLVAGLAVLWVITTAVAVLLPQGYHLVSSISSQVTTKSEPVAHRSSVNRHHIWQITLLVYTCLWGCDYLIGPQKSSMHAVEKTMPLTLWGALLLFFGIVGLLGEVWMQAGRGKTSDHETMRIWRSENRWWPSFGAHTVLCGMCVGMGAGGVAEMIINEHAWGFRVPGAMFAFAIAHWVFIQKRKNAP